MTGCFNPLNHRLCLDIPQRLVLPNAWVTHIPFAMYSISAVKPAIFVELGTHIGNSYCGFCQAVATLNLKTKCFAVDTWEGDEHAGFYGLEVFEDLSKYHDPKYNSFSRLLKMTFDEAKDYFSDHSVSLLHIDGLHTYEAVKHDFENWKQKLTDNAIVIFHDTNVRERGFGVWKFWEEIAAKYPHLEFLHGNGLGVVCIGQADQVDLADLFDPDNLEDIRAFFSCVGAKYDFALEVDRLNQIVQKLTGNLAEREQIVQKLTGNLAEREQIVQKLTGNLAEREQIVQKLIGDLGQYDLTLEKLTHDLAERDQALENLQIVLTESQKEVVKYTQSTSWRITRPLRKISKLLQGKNDDPNTSAL